MTPRFHSGRQRATKDEVDTRRQRIYEIVGAQQPMTVRQVFYRAVVMNLVEKSEKGYRKVQDDLTELRRNGTLPYDWLTDEGRRPRQPYMVEGIVEALNDARRDYRKDPWQHKDELVQIWIEKNALAGVNMIGSQHGGRLIRKSTSNSPRALERKKAGERRSDAKSLKRQFALR